MTNKSVFGKVMLLQETTLIMGKNKVVNSGVVDARFFLQKNPAEWSMVIFNLKKVIFIFKENERRV